MKTWTFFVPRSSKKPVPLISISADVSLIDREAVTVLAFSEGNGIGLRNCPAYIREWIDRERAHTKSTDSE